MTLRLDPRARTRAKRRRRERTRRALLPAVVLALGIAALFGLSWSANAVERGERLRTRLVQQRQFEADELRRLRTTWLQQTAREAIVERAKFELGLQDVVTQAKEVIVMRSPAPAPVAKTPALVQFVQRLGRLAGIRDAEAGEPQGGEPRP